MLIAGSALLLGVIHLAHVPTKPAITICVFVIGLPAAMTYVSESGGLQLSVLLRAMWHWRWSAHTLQATSPGEPCQTRGVVILTEREEPGEPSGESPPGLSTCSVGSASARTSTPRRAYRRRTSCTPRYGSRPIPYRRQSRRLWMRCETTPASYQAFF